MEIPSEARGKELSCEEMERYGARLTRYTVLDGHGINLLRNIINGCKLYSEGVIGIDELEEKCREVV